VSGDWEERGPPLAGSRTHWWTFRPADPTSAERKRRYRCRRYGFAYYGKEGEVQELRLPDAKEVAAIEAEGRALMAEAERPGIATVLGEADHSPPLARESPESRCLSPAYPA
jgi:hypothetical protein